MSDTEFAFTSVEGSENPAPGKRVFVIGRITGYARVVPSEEVDWADRDRTSSYAVMADGDTRTFEQIQKQRLAEI